MTIKDELNKVLGGRMSRNSLFALVQSIVVTLCMFLSFRITLQEVGEELIGVWFLLLAGTAFVRVGDLSGVGALSRFVAMRTYRDQGDWAIRAINTVLITAVGMNLLIAFFVWVFAPVFIPRVFEPGFQQYAFALLPFAVSNMFLGAMAIAVTSGIDGTQRADQRAILMITVSIFMLVACFLLVPMYGIFGFVSSQLAQQAIIVIAGWVVIRSHVPGLGVIPYKWERDVFYETTGYAVKLSGIGIVSVLFEPMVRFSINHVGGLSSVTVYEMASRLVIRMRDLVVAAALPLVPAFAAHRSSRTDEFKTLLINSTRLASIAACINTFIILSLAPVVSFVIFEEISWPFITITTVLAAARHIQLPAVAHYFAAQGQGILKWNFASHAVISASVMVSLLANTDSQGTSGIFAGIVIGFIASILPIYVLNAYALGVQTTLVSTLRWVLPSILITSTVSFMYLTFLYSLL